MINYRELQVRIEESPPERPQRRPLRKYVVVGCALVLCGAVAPWILVLLAIAIALGWTVATSIYLFMVWWGSHE